MAVSAVLRTIEAQLRATESELRAARARAAAAEERAALAEKASRDAWRFIRTLGHLERRYAGPGRHAPQQPRAASDATGEP